MNELSTAEKDALVNHLITEAVIQWVYLIGMDCTIQKLEHSLSIMRVVSAKLASDECQLKASTRAGKG